MKFSALQSAVLCSIFLAVNSFLVRCDGQVIEQKAHLYFFTNASCGPCRVVEPEVERLYREGYSVMKIDTSLHPDWTQRFQVTKTPTVMLVSGNRVLARQSGYVDANEMKEWFSRFQSTKATNPKLNANVSDNEHCRNNTNIAGPQNSTVHKGTFQPKNSIEYRAMQATVKLKIDDPLGTSYATGTVIHSVDGESLVLTCGHVFRDSNGTGEITAEYGFADGQIKVATGELLFYDADARDIGLVAISTGTNIAPVELAKVDFPVVNNTEIFSIGCDQGNPPSIRHSKLKNRAKYDGVIKYEIFGRPVNGRSGGGLFTNNGQLIGVCNAAVVDVDEGVYVALDTIHWQLDKVNLAHLFPSEKVNDRATPSAALPASRLAQIDSTVRPKRVFDSVPVRSPDARRLAGHDLAQRTVANQGQRNTEELIVVLRNREENGQMESWTITNPSPALINKLKDLQRKSPEIERSETNRIAELRRDMPNLQQTTGKNYNGYQLRAQSPK